MKQYIIDDLIRTISRRFDFYTNSLNCTESTDLETNTQELDLPRRIFIDIPGAGVKFSDLVFHNDDIDDILIEQADQLLDVKLTRENFLTNEYKDLAILGSKGNGILSNNYAFVMNNGMFVCFRCSKRFSDGQNEINLYSCGGIHFPGHFHCIHPPTKTAELRIFEFKNTLGIWCK